MKSHPVNTPHQQPYSGSDAVVFTWLGPAKNEAAQQWRVAADRAMRWLVQDLPRPVACSGAEQYSGVRQLTQMIMARGYNAFLCESENADPQWLEPWKKAQADEQDRRDVVAFLGKTRARREDVGNLLGHLMGVVNNQGDHWLSEMAARSWYGISVPIWMPEDLHKELAISDGNDPDVQHLYRTWESDDQTGLHEDLVAFLRAFCAARPQGRSDLLHGGIKIAKCCVLWRALGVVAPERIPPSTVHLLDEVEARLAPEMLKGQPHISPGLAQVVQAAWDRQMLSQVADPPEGKTNTRGPSRRTL